MADAEKAKQSSQKRAIRYAACLNQPSNRGIIANDNHL